MSQGEGSGQTRAVRVLRWLVRLGGGFLVLLAGLAWRWHVTGLPPFLDVGRNAWAIATYSGAEPFHLRPRSATPALTGRDVRDRPSWFVADPFMLRRDGRWHLFFESLTKGPFHGDIGYASSADGLAWQYHQVVLDEPWHLSFPLVFEHAGEVYMTPESFEHRQVRLYRGAPFPLRWEPVATLVDGRDLLDPVVFEVAGHWYMFASVPGGRRLHLLHAPALTGPWTDHPASPVVEDDPRRARPAGRVVVHQGRRWRLAQDGDGDYGRAVRAIEILEITPTTYREAPGLPEPFLAAGQGWNGRGMHHADLHLVDGTWWAAVDGRGEYRRFGLGFF